MLIGLGGYAESGKDAVADYLVEKHGWAKTYMSKPLEQALLTLDPMVPDGWVRNGGWIHLTHPFHHAGTQGTRDENMTFIRYSALHAKVGYDASKKNPEVRRLLQILGTEVGRKMFGEDVWVNIGFREIDAALSEGANISITGIRFANELDAITDRRGLAVWVDRGLPPVNSHASDNTLGPEDFDVVLENSGTLNDLYGLVDGLLTAVKVGRTIKA